MISAIFGATSGLVGAGVSALIPKLPAGAIIVVVASVLFVVSLLFGLRCCVVRRIIEHELLRRRIGRQHLLRAMHEWCEPQLAAGGPAGFGPVPWDYLLQERSWTANQLGRHLRAAQRDELVVPIGHPTWRLTESGFAEAARVTRNHRLGAARAAEPAHDGSRTMSHALVIGLSWHWSLDGWIVAAERGQHSRDRDADRPRRVGAPADGPAAYDDFPQPRHRGPVGRAGARGRDDGARLVRLQRYQHRGHDGRRRGVHLRRHDVRGQTNAVDATLGHPQHDPHGEPIPSPPRRTKS